LWGRNYNLAGLDRNRSFARNLCKQPPFNDVVVKHKVLRSFGQGSPFLFAEMGRDAPRSGELGVQEHAAS
jgi:hypothetical protein